MRKDSVMVKLHRLLAPIAGASLIAGVAVAQQTTPPQPRGQDNTAIRPGEGAARPGDAADRKDAQSCPWQTQLEKIAESPGNNAGDKAFVLGAAMGSRYEVELSRLAERKSQSQQVKQIAQKIIQDHEQASQRLMPVAQKLGVEVPTELPKNKQTKLRIKGALEGQAFDQAYIAAMDAHHAHDVAMFTHQAQLAQSPEVKQFAAQTLPALQQHHQQVRQTAGTVGLGGGEAQPAGSRIPANSDDRERGPGTINPERKPAPPQ